MEVETVAISFFGRTEVTTISVCRVERVRRGATLLRGTPVRADTEGAAVASAACNGPRDARHKGRDKPLTRALSGSGRPLKISRAARRSRTPARPPPPLGPINDLADDQ